VIVVVPVAVISVTNAVNFLVAVLKAVKGSIAPETEYVKFSKSKSPKVSIGTVKEQTWDYVH